MRPENSGSEQNPVSLLLVDDDEDVLASLVERFKMRGYAVAAFSDSIAALASFKEKPDFFDILVTDWQMPGMNGGKLIKEIRKIRANIGIIVLTGSSWMVDEDLDVKVLEKPISFEKIEEAIREVAIRRLVPHLSSPTVNGGVERGRVSDGGVAKKRVEKRGRVSDGGGRGRKKRRPIKPPARATFQPRGY